MTKGNYELAQQYVIYKDTLQKQYMRIRGSRSLIICTGSGVFLPLDGLSPSYNEKLRLEILGLIKNKIEEINKKFKEL